MYIASKDPGIMSQITTFSAGFIQCVATPLVSFSYTVYLSLYCSTAIRRGGDCGPDADEMLQFVWNQM